MVIDFDRRCNYEYDVNDPNGSFPDQACELTFEQLRILLNFCYSELELPVLRENGVFTVRMAALNAENRRKMRDIMRTKKEAQA